MGIFTRRPQEQPVPVDGQVADSAVTSEKSLKHHHGRHGPLILPHSSRPTFGQWLNATWLDILTMAIMGGIGLGVYMAHPAPTRFFPVYFEDGEVVYSEFTYPMPENITNIYVAVLLAALVPIFIILCMQIRIRSFWDVNNAILGLLYSLITAAVFQVFLKWLVGGLRPNFLAICKPVLPDGVAVGTGYRQIMYDSSICSGDRAEIDDALESFPSGPSTAAFAGFVFLALYLNAKLKVAANYHPAMWKMAAVYAPVLGATIIAGSLTINDYQNWYDCAAGAAIGTLMAFSAYRMVYASVWDFRFNHIPLNRNLPFGYGAGQAELANAVFTRRAGWGVGEGEFGGAPFDAAGAGAGAGGLGGVDGGVLGSHHRNGNVALGHHHGGLSEGHHYETSTINRRPVGAPSSVNMV